MRPKSQHWIWMGLAVLALAMISFLAMPPAVIKQAKRPAELGLRGE